TKMSDMDGVTTAKDLVKRAKFYITAIKIYNASCLRYFQIFIPGNQFICVIFCRLVHTEALSRPADFSQAEIIQLYCNHVFLRSLNY
ncbi:hypothetical protein PZH33_21640, partial [Blautia schinkii]